MTLLSLPFFLILTFTYSTQAQFSGYAQCGGSPWCFNTDCQPGYTCSYVNPYYSQCTPAPIPAGNIQPYGQCGAQSPCSPGYACVIIGSPGGAMVAQCMPLKYSTLTTVNNCASPTVPLPVAGQTIPTSSTSTLSTSSKKSSSSSSSTSPSKTSSSSKKTSTTASSTTTTSVSKSSTTTSTTLSTSTKTTSSGLCSPTPQSCASTISPPVCAGKVRFAGINIAGCEFGTTTDGTQPSSGNSGSYCPTGSGNPDGPGQMAHFASKKFNIFRLPTGWQYITQSSTPSVRLDPTNWANYKKLVQACLATGAYCIIDIHNYARFNGQIIGQGGPTDAIFAGLWAKIATDYATNSKIIFGIMNEPHDLPSINIWKTTVQTVVREIRKAGAQSQMILLPGNGWAGAGNFITSGSADALSSVVDFDGSTNKLIFDVHKYLDADGSGTSTVCTGDQIDSAFRPLAQWLRCHGRQAMLTETGGSSDTSCLTHMCSAVKFLNANSDVYLGYLGWGAGSFSAPYTLLETPTYQNGKWTDQPIVSQCLVPL